MWWARLWVSAATPAQQGEGGADDGFAVVHGQFGVLGAVLDRADHGPAGHLPSPARGRETGRVAARRRYVVLELGFSTISLSRLSAAPLEWNVAFLQAFTIEFSSLRWILI